MIAFNNKKDLVEFFKFVTEKLEKDLEESSFEVTLSIMPISTNNLKAVYDTFQAYQKTKEHMIQPVKTAAPLDINT